MDFINVTDVSIPEGKATKITETVGGRILWQKKYSPIVRYHWEIIDFQNDKVKNNYYERVYDLVDTGDGVEFFCNGDGGQSSGLTKSRPARRFHYKRDESYGDVYTLWRGTKLQSDDLAEIEYRQLSSEAQSGKIEPINDAGWSRTPYSADIDPESKKWCVAGTNYYVSNGVTPAVWQHFSQNIGAQLCCWSPKLKRFCLTNGSNAALVDTSGNVTGIVNTGMSSPNMQAGYNSNLIWSDELDKFIVCRGVGINNTYSRLRESSNGLNWSDIAVNFSGGIASELNTLNGQGKLVGLCWMGNIRKFVILGIDEDNYYIYTSTDSKNWTHVYTLDHMNANSAIKIPYESSVVYAPKKQVLLLSGKSISYLTRDLLTWTKVSYADGMYIVSNGRRWTKWSDSLGAFIHTSPFNGPVGKLVIDN